MKIKGERRKGNLEFYDLSNANPNNTARLLAMSPKESGAWLRALPVASIGNLHDMRLSASPSLFDWAAPSLCLTNAFVVPR